MNVRAIFFGLLCLLISMGSANARIAYGQLSLESVSLTPLSRALPGGVLILQAKVSNFDSSVAGGPDSTGDINSATILVSLDEFPKLQSTRRVVMDSNQSQQFDLFVPIPDAARNLKTLHITATLMTGDGERETIVQHANSPARQTLSIDVGAGRTAGMAMRADPPKQPAWFWPPALPSADYEYAIATRLAAGNDRTFATFDDRPPTLAHSAWQGLDLLVISDSSLLEDAAIVATLRGYMASGGRVWIMLDRVPCALVRDLLAPDQLCEEVERIELNDFVVDSFGSMAQLSVADRRVVSDVDLPMVRVVQDGGNVRFSVAGWPAAIEMSMGYGQLVLTTLDSRAWIEPRTTQTNPDSRFQSTYQPRPWAKFFAIDINASRPKLPLTEPLDYPLKRIGNPVVPRPWVAATLLGFFVCLAGLGTWLAYVGRLTVIGLVVPGTAILTGLSLIGLASWTRRDIQESLSRFQVIEIQPDGNRANIREQAAVYLTSSTAMQLECKHGGHIHTSDAIASGVSRLVHEDFDSWKLTNAAWPPGSWRYAAEYSVPTQELTVRATLSNVGVHLHMPPQMSAIVEDPVLSFSSGDPMLCEQTGDGFNAQSNITVEGDRWILGSILSDEQQRRLAIYRQLFQADNSVQRPIRRLYGWTQPWDATQWNRELINIGSALISLPIRIERPTIGSSILVPHGLIKLQRNASSPNVTSTFDDRTGKWRKEVSAGAEADMQFVLPSEVIPLAASAIDFELDIRAPQREVMVYLKTEAGEIDLVKLDSPSLPWRATITDSAVLAAATQGVLNVVIKVSDSRDKDGLGISSNMVKWQIDHFHASVRGTVQAQSSLSSDARP